MAYMMTSELGTFLIFAAVFASQFVNFVFCGRSRGSQLGTRTQQLLGTPKGSFFTLVVISRS